MYKLKRLFLVLTDVNPAFNHGFPMFIRGILRLGVPRAKVVGEAAAGWACPGANDRCGCRDLPGAEDGAEDGGSRQRGGTAPSWGANDLFQVTTHCTVIWW